MPWQMLARELAGTTHKFIETALSNMHKNSNKNNSLACCNLGKLIASRHSDHLKLSLGLEKTQIKEVELYTKSIKSTLLLYSVMFWFGYAESSSIGFTC